jgi:DNA-binding transcriptional regulator YdaS (Cro superfamily)
MPVPSFHAWLEQRLEEVPDTASLALAIARSGSKGISRDALRHLQISPETLEDLLRALVAAGQVRVLKVGGEWRYRAV